MGLFSKLREKRIKKWKELLNVPDVKAIEEVMSSVRDLNEFYIWYDGNEVKLSRYYERFKTSKTNPKAFYFWCESHYSNIKRTHSGLPLAIVDALVNATGVPEITSEDVSVQERIDYIKESNDFLNLIKQEEMPLTLVGGYGVLIPNYINDEVYIEFVKGTEIDILKRYGRIIGIIKHTKYDNGFRLEETRKVGSISYQLFKDGKPVALNKLKETQDLEDIILPIEMGLPFVLTRFKSGTTEYGRSIFQGKVSIFDDFDQTWSRISDNVRSHSVNTYMSADLLESDNNGKAITPDKFGARITVLRKQMNEKTSIQTEQPQIVYDGLIQVARQQLMMALAGTVAPNSIGFELQTTPNAESQREREKTTLITRNDIIDNQTEIVKRMMQLALMMEDFANSKKIVDYEIGVAFDDYASPTFNDRINTLLPLFNSLAISPEKFVEELWAGDLDEIALEEEIQRVKSLKGMNDFDTLREFTPFGLDNDSKQEDEELNEVSDA